MCLIRVADQSCPDGVKAELQTVHNLPDEVHGYIINVFYGAREIQDKCDIVAVSTDYREKQRKLLATSKYQAGTYWYM